jgi:hypothetical protein
LNKKKYICTYFDNNYLPRGLALYYSIKRYHADYEFFALTFDDQAYDYLMNLKERNLKLISITDYNSYFKTTEERFTDKKQYFFSATPNLCIYLLEKNPDIDILLYLDADVYLFSALDPLYEEFGNFSIGYTPHRVNPFLRFFVKDYGQFNIGVNLFRNSETGLKCLMDWKNDCDSWYPGKPEYPLKFFSDQIFLDSWAKKYQDIRIIENPGINLVYWNAANYTLSKKGNSYYVDNKPLIIYHFSSLRKINNKAWNTNSIYGLLSIKDTILEIYTDYIKHIESFGLNNSTHEKLNHKESLKKRAFHFVMKFFLNETINIE